MKSLSSTVVIGMLFLFSSCKKAVEAVIDHGSNTTPANTWIEYTIQKGQHYADQNGVQLVQYNEQKFTVRFDSSAIYQTVDSSNQEDINKLYGFSDNNADHELYSARFGWNWARNALRLYAYIYNNGVRSSQEITSIAIGPQYECSIKVSADQYIFSANNVTIVMPRSSTTPEGEGYKLYPYFGGDETAPHEIEIWIEEVSD